MKQTLLFAAVVALGACAAEKSADETANSTGGAETPTKTAPEMATKAAPETTNTAPEPVAKPALDPDYAADVKSICNADALSGADKVKDPSQRVEKMVTWLRGTIKTEKAKKLLQSFGSMRPDKREGMLRAEAAKAGLDGCAMADSGGK